MVRSATGAIIDILYIETGKRCACMYVNYGTHCSPENQNKVLSNDDSVFDDQAGMTHVSFDER